MTVRGFDVEIRPVRTTRSRRPIAVAVGVGIALIAAQFLSLIWPPSGGAGLAFGGTPPGPGQVAGLTTGRATDPRDKSASAPRAQNLACTEPLGWRVASIETWPGGIAYVWRATEAKVASSPLDPAIGFMPIVSARIADVGWCAPVGGPLRPPADLQATLFRLEGPRATLVEVGLAPDVESGPFGAMWVQMSNRSPRQSWANGRYVIRVATDDDAWVRWLGVEVRAYGTVESDARPDSVSGGRAPS
ncbi:MAG: hypothetical protein ABI573_11785 [Chloroflexota bacterium]